MPKGGESYPKYFKMPLRDFLARRETSTLNPFQLYLRNGSDETQRMIEHVDYDTNKLFFDRVAHNVDEVDLDRTEVFVPLNNMNQGGNGRRRTGRRGTGRRGTIRRYAN